MTQSSLKVLPSPSLLAQEEQLGPPNRPLLVVINMNDDSHQCSYHHSLAYSLKRVSWEGTASKTRKLSSLFVVYNSSINVSLYSQRAGNGAASSFGSLMFANGGLGGGNPSYLCGGWVLLLRLPLILLLSRNIFLQTVAGRYYHYYLNNFYFCYKYWTVGLEYLAE